MKIKSLPPLAERKMKFEYADGKQQAEADFKAISELISQQNRIPQRQQSAPRKEEAKTEQDKENAPIIPSKLDQAFEERQMQQPAAMCQFSKKYMLFRPYIDPMTIRPYKPADKGLYFKNYNGIDVKLIRFTMEDNGFREATDRKQEWSLMWACSNIKSVVYQSLTRY